MPLHEHLLLDNTIAFARDWAHVTEQLNALPISQSSSTPKKNQEQQRELPQAASPSVPCDLTPVFQALDSLTARQEHLKHFIKFALEIVRLNDEITELQFRTKYQQEHPGKLCSYF